MHDYMRRIMPYFYHTGQKKIIFTNSNFYQQILIGILQAIFLFTVNYYCLDENYMIDGDGHTVDFWMFSMHIYTAIVIMAELRISLLTKYWTIINVVFLSFLSFFLFIIYMYVSD